MPTALGTVASHRSQTGPSVPPISTIGLTLWLDAADASTFSYGSGVSVSQWRDKSATGWNFEQSYTPGQPSRDGTINGKTALNLTSTQSLVATFVPAVAAQSKNVTFFIASHPGALVSTFAIPFHTGSSGSSEGGWGPGHRVNSTTHMGFNFAWVAHHTTDNLLTPTAPNIMTMVIGNQATPVTTLYSDGVAGTPTRTGGPSPSTLVARINDQGWLGQIGEIIIYDRALSPVERQEVESYLRKKWIVNSTNPFTMAPWHTAYWASDSAWTPPTDGGAMTTWRDGSGNGRTMTTVTGGPTYRTSSVLNGKPAIEFDGIDDAMNSGATFASLQHPFTVVGVIQAAKTTNHFFFSAPTASTWDHSIGIHDGKWATRDNAAVYGTTADTSRHLVCGFFTGPYRATMMVDGIKSPDYTQASSGEPTSGPWRLGEGQFGIKGQYTIGFVGFLHRALTVQEEADLLAWSRSFYATPGPPFPFTVPNLAAWYDADDAASLTLTGSLVEQWRDRSGNDYHLTPRQPSYRPSRTGTSLSGKSAVTYDDGHRLHSTKGSSAIGSVSQAVTVISAFKADLPVVNYPAPPGTLTAFSAQGAPLEAWGQARYIGGNPLSSPGGHWSPGDANYMRTSTIYSQVLYLNGATPTFYDYINGFWYGQGTIADGPLPTVDQVISIGSRDDNVTMFRGQVYECLIYNRVLTTQERQQVEAYLYNKWYTSTAVIPTKDLVGWWDADDAASFTYTSGSSVLTWADKSEAKSHLTRRTAGNEPTRTGTQNGHATVVFAPGAVKILDRMTDLGARIGGLCSYSIFYTFKREGPVNTYDAPPVLLDTLDCFWNQLSTMGMPTITCRHVLAATSWELWEFVMTVPNRYHPSDAPLGTATISQYVNGRLLTTRSPDRWHISGGHVGGNIQFGSRNDAATQFSGEIGEVVMYNRVLPDNERQQVESYLMAKWIPPGTPEEIIPGFNPLSINWFSAWWASDPGWTPPADGGTVSSWRNAGSSAADAVMATPGSRPTYRASYTNLNGRPAVEFNGDNWMNTTHANSVQPNHYFIVAWLDPTHVADTTLVDGGQNRNLIRNRGTGNRYQLYAGVSTSQGIGRDGPFITAVLFNGTASYVRENGFNSEMADAGTFSMNNTIIGADPNMTSAYAFKGGIAFLGWKNGILTSNEIANLEAWASSYYGIPL